MNKRAVTLVLSMAIIASFFFPVFYWDSYEMSGPNYILSIHVPTYKYLLLLAPFSMLLLFFSNAYQEFAFFNRRILVWIPLVSLTLVFATRYRTWVSSMPSETFLSTIGIGLWLMLFFAILLVFRRTTTGNINFRH